jgi:hypothetical protein
MVYEGYHPKQIQVTQTKLIYCPAYEHGSLHKKKLLKNKFILTNQ